MPVTVMVKRPPRVNASFDDPSAAKAGMTMAAMKKMIPRTVMSAVCFCIFLSLKPYRLIVDLTFTRSWIKGCTVKDQEQEIIFCAGAPCFFPPFKIRIIALFREDFIITGMS